jgi:hypothetical protein
MLGFAAQASGNRERPIVPRMSQDQVAQFSVGNMRKVLGDLRKRPSVSNKHASGNELEELTIGVNGFFAVALGTTYDAPLSIITDHTYIWLRRGVPDTANGWRRAVGAT